MKNYLEGDLGTLYTWIIYLIGTSILLYISEHHLRTDLLIFIETGDNKIIFLLLQIIFSVLLLLAVGLLNVSSRITNKFGKYFTGIFASKDLLIILAAETSAIKALLT